MSTETTPAAPRREPHLARPSAAPRGRIEVGSVLSRAFSVWWGNAGVFTGIAVLFAMPGAAITLLGGGGEGGTAAAGFVGGVLGLATTGALTQGVLQALAGREVQLGAMLGTGVRKLAKVFLVSMGVGILMLLGTILLVVPGMIAAATYWVAAPAAVAEEGGAGEAMSRSAVLSKGHRMTLFAAFGVTTLVTLAVGLGVAFGAEAVAAAIIGPPVENDPRLGAIVDLVAAAASTFAYAAPAVAYHDLRVLREGVDTGQLARVFD
jgi:hypothetical protein